jgi:hypothetical protein
MTAPPARDRTLQALLAFLAASVLATAAAILYVGMHRREPSPVVAIAAREDAGTSPLAVHTAWAPSLALAQAVDVAFASGASLSTDGKAALYQPGDGSPPRPVEVPAAISRVFGAAGRLFAAGENEGAPFLIRMAPGEDPLVVPMPCVISRLGGEGQILAGTCVDGSGIASSTDGGKSFRPAPVDFIAPKGVGDSPVERSVEAVAVSPSGAQAIAVSQRWQTEEPGGVLSWTWGQVGLRVPGGRFRFLNVHALAHTVGLHYAGGALTLAGLEVALDGPADGQVHVRLFRAGEGEPPVPVGTAGPPCGTVATARAVEGVLLGTRVAALRCGETLVTTLDGGASWITERGLGSVQVIRGGDMRLFARAGERAFERRFVDRAESGATAVRLPGAVLPKRDAGEAPPLAAPFGIKEPQPDGGEPSATDGG